MTTKKNDPMDTTGIVSTTFTNVDNHHNFIFATEKNPCKYMLMNYLTLRDIIPFGFTCKTLYVKVFEQEETRTLRRFCTVDIPAHIIPHLKYLLEETPENLIAIKVIHQIKRNNVFGYSLNGVGRMLRWKNHGAIDAGIISTTYGGGNVITWGNQNHGADSTAVQNQLQNIKMIFSTNTAFAALANDGNVVSWGSQDDDYNPIDASNQLQNIKMIFSNTYAFSALK